MEQLLQFAWVPFLALGLYLLRTGRGNLWLTLAVLAWGVNGLLRLLIDREVIPGDAVGWLVSPEFRSVFSLATSAALLIGLFLLTSRGADVRRRRDARGRSAGRAPLDAGGSDLATLFIPRNSTNTFSRAEPLRDEACARLTARAKADGLEVIEQKSNLHSPAVWFRLDYLFPQPDAHLSLRGSVAVEVERFDFHRFEHLFTVTARVGVDEARVEHVISIDDRTADRIHRFMVRPGQRLRIPNRTRQQFWQLWRPRNRVERLGRDWAAAGIVLAGLVACAALAVAGNRTPGVPELSLVWPLPLLLTAVILHVRKRRRRTYILTTGKPAADPRRLHWMDSWQVTVGGLAGQALETAKALIERLRAGAPRELVVRVERIGYWGVDSRVVRDQICIRYRRAIAFVHVVPHGQTLYLAWECHLNYAAWEEQVLASGYDKHTGKTVVANRIVAGTHALNEYDIADSNFLGELVHEAMKREVKLQMAQRQIDEEIDFTVQRESRKSAVGVGTPPADGDGKQKKARVKRTG